MGHRACLLGNGLALGLALLVVAAPGLALASVTLMEPPGTATMPQRARQERGSQSRRSELSLLLAKNFAWIATTMKLIASGLSLRNVALRSMIATVGGGRLDRMAARVRALAPMMTRMTTRLCPRAENAGAVVVEGEATAVGAVDLTDTRVAAEVVATTATLAVAGITTGAATAVDAITADVTLTEGAVATDTAVDATTAGVTITAGVAATDTAVDVTTVGVTITVTITAVAAVVMEVAPAPAATTAGEMIPAVVAVRMAPAVVALTVVAAAVAAVAMAAMVRALLLPLLMLRILLLPAPLVPPPLVQIPSALLLLRVATAVQREEDTAAKPGVTREQGYFCQQMHRLVRKRKREGRWCFAKK